MPNTLDPAGRCARLVAEHLPITAHHEAAHAVMYWHKGLAFRYVTIRARHAVGQVALRRPRPTLPWDLGDIAAAGPVAELHYLGRTVDDEEVIETIEAEVDFAELEGEEWAASGDYVTFGRVVPREAWLTTWRAVQGQVTSYLWPAVVAVGEALLDSPRALTYREVASLSEAALREP